MGRTTGAIRPISCLTHPVHYLISKHNNKPTRQAPYSFPSPFSHPSPSTHTHTRMHTHTHPQQRQQVATPRKHLGYDYPGVTVLNFFLFVLICLHVYWMVRTRVFVCCAVLCCAVLCCAVLWCLTAIGAHWRCGVLYID
jgi:hypothetical protein